MNFWKQSYSIWNVIPFRDEGEGTVAVGTADGHMTLIPVAFFKQGHSMVIPQQSYKTEKSPDNIQYNVQCILSTATKSSSFLYRKHLIQLINILFTNDTVIVL